MGWNTGLTCADCGRPMARAAGSLPQGQARCHPCRRQTPTASRRTPEHGDLTCADCGKLMWRSRTSLPQGRARCLPCRRARPCHAKRPSVWTPQDVECRICSLPFTQRRYGQVYCSALCRDSRMRFRTIKKASSTSRGYGWAHQTARREAAARHSPDDPCARCGEPLGPMGPTLHYDHSDDRADGYLGFSHARCNLIAGARRSSRSRMRRTLRCERGCCEMPWGATPTQAA